MKIKQKITILAFFVGMLGILLVSQPSVAYAAPTKEECVASGKTWEDGECKSKCGGADTAIITCKADNSGDLKKNGIWDLLIMGINILTAGIGIAAVGGVIYGSILYTTAGDNDSQIKQAKEVIRNVVIGLVMYAAMYALLQFIIPGGIFT